MKKQLSKLTVQRETLRHLDPTALRVAGAYDDSIYETCIFSACYSDIPSNCRESEAN